MTVVDAKTLKSSTSGPLPFGIRPNVVTRDGKTTYADVVSERLCAKVDMATGKGARAGRNSGRATTPGTLQDQGRLSAELAFNGMAINGAETKPCMAGTIDNHIVWLPPVPGDDN